MRIIVFVLMCALSLQPGLYAHNSEVSIVGGGIIGALESYFTYLEAKKEGKKVCVIVYEKGEEFDISNHSKIGYVSSNTAYNIVPSLTIDEILSVVPRGSELIEKLKIHFSMPGGIRVDDVEGINDSQVSERFKAAVVRYGADRNHDDRTNALLSLGKMSMDQWQKIYDDADDELKAIFKASNFNPCREPRNESENILHDGYRVDLIYGIPNAQARAQAMKADYEKMGYQHCRVLLPEEVIALDPYLADFCTDHSKLNIKLNIWNNDTVALWRPGGCIDTAVFLPKFYAYLKKVMGQYTTTDGRVQDCFCVQFNSEVVGVQFDPVRSRVVGLTFQEGEVSNSEAQYVFAPGEAVGSLSTFGFDEPAYAVFAGPSLVLTIPLSNEQFELYKNFSHCMEVHNEGIVLAWQARLKERALVIGVAGTKAFYGDKQPHVDEAFAINRNLVQLNMINDVLPNCVSLALGCDTRGKVLGVEDLATLVEKKVAKRWVGKRAVAYDGFPTLGSLYVRNQKVSNARCTTHLGSGGVSFAPAAILVSRLSNQDIHDEFMKKILQYADSRRVPSSK